MFLEALSCLHPESLGFIPAADVRREQVDQDPYQRILSDSFRSRLVQSRGTIQILVHPYFGEFNPKIKLPKIPQFYYDYKRSQVLQGLGDTSLPTITLLAEDELLPSSIYSLLEKYTIILPTISQHPVPDIDGQIRASDTVINNLLMKKVDTSAPSNSLTLLVQQARNSELHNQARSDDPEYRRFSNQRDSQVFTAWNVFAATLRQAGVQRAVLRGKVEYVKENSDESDGCLPEVRRQLEHRRIATVLSKVRYIHHIS